MAAGGLISTVLKVISEEMNKEGVLQMDVPEDPHINPSDVQQVKKNSEGRRYYRCKGFAHFDEVQDVDEPDQPNQPEQPDQACEHTWKSAHAWCVKKQRIAYHWCQECNQCEGES